MGIFKTNKQSDKPLDRIIIFASDASEKFYCEIYYVEAIRNGRIVAENEEISIPIDEATPFVTKDGILYAANMSLEYLKEIQHLGEVEKNIIIEQAFLYPGRGSNEIKSNMLTFVIIGVLGLLALVGLFV